MEKNRPEQGIAFHQIIAEGRRPGRFPVVELITAEMTDEIDGKLHPFPGAEGDLRA